MSIVSKSKDMNLNTLSKKKIENDKYQSQRNSKSILIEILKNSSLRSAFNDFLKSQFCVENLLCWEAIEKYKSKNGTAPEMYTMAEEIYKKFIKDNSKYEINIYSKQKDLLKEKLKKTFILPTNINKTETFPKRKSKKKYWADVILPALKSSTSYGSGSSGSISNIFSSPSTTSTLSSSTGIVNGNHHTYSVGTPNSYIYSTSTINGNGSTNGLSNSNGSSQASIVSPKFFHSPRVSRNVATNPSPQQSPYTSPFCSPNHSPTSSTTATVSNGNAHAHQDNSGTITYYSTSSTGAANGSDSVVGNGYHPHSYSNSNGNYNSIGTSSRKSIINGSSSFSCIDDSTDLDVDFDDLFNDESIDVDEVRFGSLSCIFLFTDVQEELEQMMIENSLGEFLKSKIYIERSQGYSLQ